MVKNGAGVLNAIRDRAGILSAVSNWLKLLALVVLVGEGVIITAMTLTPQSHPLKGWYPLFMLLLLLVIVVGIFVDRVGERRSKTAFLGFELEGKKISVNTSQTVLAKPETLPSDTASVYSDSQRGFMFALPASKNWSKPQHLDIGSFNVELGLSPDIETWNKTKEAGTVLPMGKMMVEANVVSVEHGEPLDCELTDKTSSRQIDTLLNRLVELAKKEEESPDDEELNEMVEATRKQLIRGQTGIERLKLKNTFSVVIYDKALAQESPIVPSLGNFFLQLMRIVPVVVDKLVANEESILWGATQTLTNVMINGSQCDVTTYSLERLLQSNDLMFLVTVRFYPQTEESISVWEELREMFDSFRVVA